MSWYEKLSRFENFSYDHMELSDVELMSEYDLNSSESFCEASEWLQFGPKWWEGDISKLGLEWS